MSELSQCRQQLPVRPGAEVGLPVAADLHEGHLGEAGLDEGPDLLHVLLDVGAAGQLRADLPAPSSFEGATQFVTPEQVAEQVPCGPDVQEHVEKITPFLDAGFTEVALVQIGGDRQAEFCAWAERELLPALRAR